MLENPVRNENDANDQPAVVHCTVLLVEVI